MSRIVRNALAVGSAVLLAASLSATAFAADPVTNIQTASNTATVIQTGVAVTGPAVATGPSYASSGDASVTLKGTQEQSNVQVAGAASIASTAPNSTTTNAGLSTQQATNWGGIQQTGAAVTGAAVAIGTATDEADVMPAVTSNSDGGAAAYSGDVDIEVEGTQAQKNTQVGANASVDFLVAGTSTSATGLQAQIASNTGVMLQAAAGQSGPAVAIGAFPYAESGSIYSEVEGVQVQKNTQLAANAAANLLLSGDSTSAADFLSAQVASNSASLGQAESLTTGSAVAIGALADAESGDIYSDEFGLQLQKNTQLAANAAILVGGAMDETLSATAASVQTASNIDILTQALIGQTGAAAAIGLDAAAYSGDADADAVGLQFQKNTQVFLNLAFGLFPAGSWSSDVLSVQTADQFNCGQQTGLAGSGAAVALGADAEADSYYEEGSDLFEFLKQDEHSTTVALYLNGGLINLGGMPF